MPERFYLQVPYAEKDDAKKAGSRWDPERKLWYVTDPNASARTRWPVPAPRDLPRPSRSTVHAPADADADDLPGEDRTFGGRSLFVDLIPRTCWFTNVRSAVVREDWDRLRKRVYARAEFRCEVCGKQGRLEAHERWQYDHSPHTQTLRRLIALCGDCHTATHFGLAQIRGLEDVALAHLQRVNHWSEHQARTHVESSFALWTQRNAFTWTLDLSLITSAGFRINVPNPVARNSIAQKALENRTPK